MRHPSHPKKFDVSTGFGHACAAGAGTGGTRGGWDWGTLVRFPVLQVAYRGNLPRYRIVWTGGTISGEL